MDIMGPFPTVNNHRFIITFLDIFSEYSVLVLSPDHTASAVACAVMDRVITYFGVPTRILSDRGQEFVWYVWGQMKKWLGCSMIHSSPYHSQGNAKVERSYRTIIILIRVTIAEVGQSRWPDIISSVQLTLNRLPAKNITSRRIKCCLEL